MGIYQTYKRRSAALSIHTFDQSFIKRAPIYFNTRLQKSTIKDHQNAYKTSVVVLGETDKTSLVTPDEVQTLSSKHNITLPTSGLEDWATLLTGLNHCAKEILEIPDYYPEVKTTLYPRTNIHRPQGEQETDCGGWATKVTIKCMIRKVPKLHSKVSKLEFLSKDSHPNSLIQTLLQPQKQQFQNLAELGAEVEEISIPFYKKSGLVWMVGMAMPAATQSLLSNPSGRKQLFLTDRCELSGPTTSQEAFDALGPGAQNVYLRGLFLQKRFGSPIHARCTNLRRKLSDEYDQALKDVDVLVMPTCIFPPGKIEPGGGKTLGPLKMLSRTIGIPYNTAPLSSSGHPALNLPVGFVPAKDDENVWLPTGLQIVGRKFEDLTVLKVAGSWEKANDWKTMKFGGN